MTAGPEQEYRRRRAHWDAEISATARASDRLSNLRLLTAGLAIAVGLTVMRGTLGAGWLAVPGILFLALVIWHSRVIERGQRARNAQAWYDRGLARIAGTWAGTGPDGRRFGQGHATAADLDLFGPGSLFQLLHTARTEAGEETLARWLMAPAPPAEIRARQAAVTELRSELDFRESLAVSAAGARTSRTGTLATWAAAPGSALSLGAAWLFGAVGGLSAALLVAMLLGRIPAGLFFLSLFVQFAIVVAFWRRIGRAVADVETAARDLELLAAVLAVIEAKSFTTERLRGVSAALRTGGVPASQQIARLLRWITALDSTRNQILAPFAWLVMLPYLCSLAIDRWHAEHARAIPAWLDAVGDIEALAAFATFACEHPSAAVPTIVDDGAPRVTATALAHPLIHEGTAVANDVALGAGAPRLFIVSGSNMSGKSTLLRAIGVNVVLALAGAPVRAAAMTVTPLVLGTSLRVDDSLQAGHSRFYAEILRLRAIVELTDGPAPVLFLLDEVLAGTNSHDRRIGAEAVIRTLVARGALGLVTTHDLALADVVPSLGTDAANVHFEDRVEDGRMVFDYRMRPGIVTHSNALALMRAIGLDV